MTNFLLVTYLVNSQSCQQSTEELVRTPSSWWVMEHILSQQIFMECVYCVTKYKLHH